MMIRVLPLRKFIGNCGGFGPSSYISPFGIYLVGGEYGDGLACAVYKLRRVLRGDRIYVRCPEKYGQAIFGVWSDAKRKYISEHEEEVEKVDKDLWMATVKEDDDSALLYLYSRAWDPPKLYTGAGVNIKPPPRPFLDLKVVKVMGALWGRLLGKVVLQGEKPIVG